MKKCLAHHHKNNKKQERKESAKIQNRKKRRRIKKKGNRYEAVPLLFLSCIGNSQAGFCFIPL
jgi:hypothetical protein